MSITSSRIRSRPDAAKASGGRGDVAITIADVSKGFTTGHQHHLALHDVNITVRESEFLCLVGASGCGKSTLLNLIAGLDKVTSGSIDTGGRKVAFMFQESTLFPWLTLEQNVELALKLQDTPRNERAGRVEELLDLVRLGGRGKRRPHELSGGMRQRGALARVLAQEAEIVLMDEPFAALDAMTRDSMHDEIERIWEQLKLTVVFVTHNVREAARLGQRVVLLSSRPGRVAGEWRIAETAGRRIESPEVAALSIEITDQLRKEIRRNAA